MHLRSAAARLRMALEGDWRAKARPAQLPPEGDWSIWLQLGGRGAGKTWSGANWVIEQAASPTARIAIIGATAADVRDTMVEGASGILNVCPDWDRPAYEPSKRRLSWNNGAQAACFSADEPERLRGPNFTAAWCDELCAWRYPDAVWDNLMLALRVGKNPRCAITTTPKATRLLKGLLAREGQDVVVSRSTTYDNRANLASSFFTAIASRFEGTRLGRQELLAELLDDVPGALFQRAWFDDLRVQVAPELQRVIVSLDPAISTVEGSDLTGIIVAGIGKDGHGYILDDLSGRYQPHEWAAVAIQAYHAHKADRIVAEINQGGAMVQSTLQVVDPKVAYRGVHASRGKVTRAEPVAALFEQKRVHLVGSFPELEDECCGFTSDFDRAKFGYSPDRLDAKVWGLTELMLGTQMPTSWAVPIVITRPRESPYPAEPFPNMTPQWSDA
jgi:predicted phage terminase large subunit-like protein